MISKPSSCGGCPMEKIGKGFTPLHLKNGYLLAIGEAPNEDEAENGIPFMGGSGQWLRSLTKAAGLNYENISLAHTICCVPPSNIFPGDPKCTYLSRDLAKEAIAHCGREYLWPSIHKANKGKILALGGHALQAITNREGINVWRGSPLPLKGMEEKGPKVIPTLSPTQLMRQAKFTSVVIQDLKTSLQLPPENYNLFPTLEEVEKFHAKEFAFDFEWDRFGNITLCGLSDRMYSAIVVPFIGGYIGALKEIFENARSLIGHNIINADLSYFEKLGWNLRDDIEIHDTMLKQHLIQPDYPHDLGFVASVFTNKVFWKGKGWEEEEDGERTEVVQQQWRTWDRPDLSIPREFGGYGGCKSSEEAFRLYNGRDTDGEYQINLPLSQKLKQYELENTYWNVSVPVAYICREIGERGFKLDTSRLGEIRTTLDKKIEEYESQLPPGLQPFQIEVGCNVEAPPSTYRGKVKECKGGRKESHPLYSYIFLEPGHHTCPSCGKKMESGKMEFAKVVRGTKMERIVPYNSPLKVGEYAASKGLSTILNLKTGNATTGDRARKMWSKEKAPDGMVAFPEFALLGLLKEKITLRNNFAKDSILNQERMFFNLKVHGTAEGRLSSSGRRKGIDLNIQNQPEEFRIIYVPDEEGWSILNLDIKQGENMLTAWLAKDWERWERLQTPGYDEHGFYATNFFGQPCYKGTPGEYLRAVGKVINHMLNYGASWKKLQDVLLEAGFVYTAKDCKDAVNVWKKVNARTAAWQQETIKTVERDGYLENVFGRRRWFSSRDFATKSLAFLPASTLADMVLRMMIAHYPSRREMIKPLRNLQLDMVGDICKGWRMAAQVHDSLVLMGPSIHTKEQADRSSRIMTQPWKELGGFKFEVDIKMSEKSWGDCEKYKLQYF